MVQEVRRRLGRLLWLSLAVAQVGEAQRLVVVSLDGLGHEIVTRDEVAAELTVLRATMEAGAFAQGVEATRPALTAVSHASIWTGAGPEVNGVTFNNPPSGPRKEHKLSETVIGFQGTRLLAEPFWVTAGRQGVKSLAYQPTQGFPFTPVNTGPGATVINSYQTRSYAPYALLGTSNVEWGAEGSFTFSHGTRQYRAKPSKGGVEIAQGTSQGVLVPLAPPETDAPRQRDLARHFRPVLLDGGSTGVFFRLLVYDGSTRRLRLLISAAHETGWHDGNSRRLDEVQAMLKECGPVVGNGATSLLNAGRITQAEYLETVELVIGQLTQQAGWAARRVSPRLIQAYLPYPDEFDHEWIALARGGAGRFAEYRRWGYVAVNRGMEKLAALAGDRDWLLWVSDHGMAEIRKSVSIPEMLARAGLENEAVLLYNALAVNTQDWKEGVVPRDGKDQVVRRIRGALEKLRDTENGRPIVREVLTAKDGAPQCETCGDLYYDLMPGYRTNPRRDSALVKAVVPPEGAHGFAPARADMLAIFAARGPGIRPGYVFRNMRTIDIAPYICSLLRIQPPRQAEGRRPKIEIGSSR